MMSFSEYMSLRENFDHPTDPNVGKDFGDEPNTVSPTASKDNGVHNNNFGEEAFDFDGLDEEDIDLGIDAMDVPDEFGVAAGVDSAEQFANATNANDGYETDTEIANDFNYEQLKNISPEKIHDLSDEAKANLKEAVEFILNTLNEEEYETNGEDPDDHIDDNGVDTNTIVPHNMEADQFSMMDDDNELDESATGWADLF